MSIQIFSEKCIPKIKRGGGRCGRCGIFDVLTGVKQGGVLSPRLIAIYVDNLIRLLRSKGIGCHIIEMFVACLFFADDLCLISPTKSTMQELLDVCQKYCSEINLTFNTVEPRYTRSKSNGNPPLTSAKRKSRPFLFTLFVKKIQ